MITLKMLEGLRALKDIEIQVISDIEAIVMWPDPNGVDGPPPQAIVYYGGKFEWYPEWDSFGELETRREAYGKYRQTYNTVQELIESQIYGVIDDALNQDPEWVRADLANHLIDCGWQIDREYRWSHVFKSFPNIYEAIKACIEIASN